MADTVVVAADSCVESGLQVLYLVITRHPRLSMPPSPAASTSYCNISGTCVVSRQLLNRLGSR